MQRAGESVLRDLRVQTKGTITVPNEMPEAFRNQALLIGRDRTWLVPPEPGVGGQ